MLNLTSNGGWYLECALFLQNLPMRATYVFDDASTEACGHKNEFLRLLFCITEVRNFEQLTPSSLAKKIFSVLFGALTLVREWMVRRDSWKNLMFGLPLICISVGRYCYHGIWFKIFGIGDYRGLWLLCQNCKHLVLWL